MLNELITDLIDARLSEYTEKIAELENELDNLHRKINNQIRVGKCSEANETTVTVQHGENKTPAIEWFAASAGAVREYRRPSVGEQCLILNYGGGDNSSQCFALFGVFSDQYPAPTTIESEHKTLYPDETEFIYNSHDHKFQIKMAAGEIEFIAPKLIKFDTAKLHITGNLKVDQNIKADIEIEDHTRTMQADRDIYNSHKHLGNLGLPTGVPDAQE